MCAITETAHVLKILWGFVIMSECLVLPTTHTHTHTRFHKALREKAIAWSTPSSYLSGVALHTFRSPKGSAVFLPPPSASLRCLYLGWFLTQLHQYLPDPECVELRRRVSSTSLHGHGNGTWGPSAIRDHVSSMRKTTFCSCREGRHGDKRQRDSWNLWVPRKQLFLKSSSVLPSCLSIGQQFLGLREPSQGPLPIFIWPEI